MQNSHTELPSKNTSQSTLLPPSPRPCPHLLEASKRHSHCRRQPHPVRQLAPEVGQVPALGTHHAVVELVHTHGPLAAPLGDGDLQVARGARAVGGGSQVQATQGVNGPEVGAVHVVGSVQCAYYAVGDRPLRELMVLGGGWGGLGVAVVVAVVAAVVLRG